MNGRSAMIDKLRDNMQTRWAYTKAKVSVLVPSQIRALRLKSDMPTQVDLGNRAGMKQSRISYIETPGAANVTLDTLARLAAVFKVGLVVKFVSFSEMLSWENGYSQDKFNVLRLDDDQAFINPTSVKDKPAVSRPVGSDIPGSNKGLYVMYPDLKARPPADLTGIYEPETQALSSSGERIHGQA